MIDSLLILGSLLAWTFGGAFAILLATCGGFIWIAPALIWALGAYGIWRLA